MTNTQINAIPETVDLDRAAVFHYYKGRLALLAYATGRSEEALAARAELLIEQWRLRDPEQVRCYLCGSVGQTPGKLCGCIRSTALGNFLAVHDPEILALQVHAAGGEGKDPVAARALCTSCGLIHETRGSEVLEAYARRGAYKPRRFCAACFEARKADKSRTRGGKAVRERRARMEQAKEQPRANPATRQQLERAVQQAAAAAVPAARA